MDQQKEPNTEELNELTTEELDQVSGGASFGKYCRRCGGFMTNDPLTPDELKCHCRKNVGHTAL
ncbi:MAG: bacteriocin [Clostridia bacterium]|nr:bacteriocin [Clostridia bacterium]